MEVELEGSQDSNPLAKPPPKEHARMYRLLKKISKPFASRTSASKCGTLEKKTNEKGVKLSRLELLPFELLLQITDYLVPVDYLCLASVSHCLRNSLPAIPSSSLTECHHWLLTCRFERDILFPTALSASSPSTFLQDAPPQPTIPKDVKHLACAYCKERSPLADFTGLSGEYLFHATLHEASFFGDPARLETYPEARICGYHDPDTTWMPKPHKHLVTNSKGETKYWERWMDLTCMHCGSLVNYGDTRETGCKGCKCDTCPRMLTPCYQRYGPKSRMSREHMSEVEEILTREGYIGDEIDGGPKIRSFLRTKGGKLCILEVGALMPHVVEDAQTYREAEARAGLRPEENEDENEEDSGSELALTE